MDLIKFCVDESDTRDNLRKPFNLGNFLYATNGHFCLRMDKDIDYSEENEEYRDKISAMFKGVEEAEYRDLFLIPDNKLIDCKDCAGTGFEILEECGECEGECSVLFSNKHNDYILDCKTCDAKGEVKTSQKEIQCSECCGSKQIIDSEKNYYQMGDNEVFVHISSLQVLKGIPNLKYAILENYVSFKVEDGYGIISIVEKNNVE